jgi:glycosyltransferase involved in cell wall biosynthesis
MKTGSVPLVSIVTPVYNEAEHLAECIESVLGQTYQNWDYTIVNNCSTDGSLQVARRYAAKDRRIRVHDNQQFLRVIANHNVALRQVSPSSKYCKVVFGDDWIFPECLERMVAVAEKHPSVGIVGAYAMEGQQVMWTGLTYPSELTSGHEICRRRFLENVYVFGTATSLLFRADLVRSRDPFYNESNLHADSEACVVLLKECDFGFVHQVLTFTRVRPMSLTSMTWDLNTLLAGELCELVAHGREFLTKDEYERCVDQHLSKYYRFLAGSVLRCRDRKFWNYHKGKLIAAGLKLDRFRLARATLARLVSALLNLEHTFDRLRSVHSVVRLRHKLSVSRIASEIWKGRLLRHAKEKEGRIQIR